MQNDSRLFSENLPNDGLFDFDEDGEISGFESFLRDEHWLGELENEDKQARGHLLRPGNGRSCN